MKKIFLLLVFLLQMLTMFGQQTKEINKKGPTGIVGLQQTKQYIPPANTNNADQIYKNDCYSGLVFTVKNYGYDKNGKYYYWGIKVKNNYTKAVSLRYRLNIGGEYSKNSTVTYDIKPGNIYDNDYGTIRALIVNSSSSQYRIEISEVCFEGQDCSRNGYADCNGKQAGKNSSVSNGSNNIEQNVNSNTSSNSSTQQTTQQNNLDEYNRSKQEMEAKLERGNAEIQKQNQENANRLQVYNNAIREGVAAHNSGNYTEAKNQFTAAINNSDTQQDRNNAQAYYNKTLSLEKDLSKIKAVGDFTITAINAFDKFSKENRERQRQKKETNIERISNDMEDDNFLYAFMGEIISTFRHAGYEPNSISGIQLRKNKETGTISKTQKVYYNGFCLSPSFSIYKLKGASYKVMEIECKTKEDWEKIKRLKILNKWERGRSKTSRIEDEKYSSSINLVVDYDKKKIKNYSALIKVYNDFVKIQYEKKIPNPDLNFSAVQLYQKGNEYYRNNDFQNAYQYYEAASTKGFSNAMIPIGRLYANGEGVPQDYTKTTEWYLKAANMGDIIGMYALASLYEEGVGVPEDMNKAKEWYKKACDSGFSGACEKIKKM